MRDISGLRKVHLIGVGGIGVSALGRLFASRGVELSGSDVKLPPTGTLPAGVYSSGHHEEHVPADADLVVYSPAVPETNPERIRAHRLGIPCVDYPTALGMATDVYNTIAVSGTHGKSTTTALMGLLFVEAGLDPSVIVGAVVPEWSSNFRRGESDLFIVEACEYRRHMLRLSPQTIVLTNIELDHPDYYRDLEDVSHAFRDYIAKLGDEGLLIYNRDSAAVRSVAESSGAIKISYGIGEGSDLYARDIFDREGVQQFTLVWKGNTLGEFATELPGLYNLYNILAAVAALLAYNGKADAIAPCLACFQGVGRRFEVIGMTEGGATVVSDYAHHPTALREVALAAGKRYFGKKILTVFQPHQRERTLKLWDEFVAVLGDISPVILVEPYAVPGREEGMEACGKRIVEEVTAKHPNADIVYAADLAEAEMMARKLIGEYDVILIVGAGDVDTLARKFVRSPQ